MTLLVTEGAVLSELWVSLRSLILTYLAAHESGLPGSRTMAGSGVVELEDAPFTIETGDKKLVIECKSGKGIWTVYGPGGESLLAEGSFTIGTDSMVEFSDRKGKLELDVAAEAFTAKIFDED